jgi:hypothetical protein
MRQPHTFVLTLLPDDQNAGFLRGRIRLVASEEEATFIGINELIHLIRWQIAKYGESLTQNDSGAQEERAEKE